MTPEQWTKVNALFLDALEIPSDQREAWLREAAGDEAVVSEVRALLAAHEDDPGFLEGGPAFSSVDELRALASAPAPATAAAAAEDALPSAGAIETHAASGHVVIDPLSMVGQRIGAYDVARELGRGGMGIVYLAHDTRLGRDVAIKALPREAPADPRRRERLRREARAAAALTHPAIATVFALEEVSGELYLVTEYVRGMTLREELARGALPTALWISTALALTDAIGAAHAQGIIHRDLKPENVMRTPDGALKVLDFGLARALTPWLWHDEDAATEAGPGTLTRSGMMLGTPAYMAPEQLRGEAVDPRADLFSLGVLLYELAAGRHPFEAHALGLTVHRLMNEPPRPLLEAAPLFPARAAAIVHRCLEKWPAARYGSADELARDLLRLQETPASHAAASPAFDASATTPRADASRTGEPRTGTGGAPDPLAAAGSVPRPASDPGGATVFAHAPSSSMTPASTSSPPIAPPIALPLPAGSTESASRPSQWWWRFHQVAVALFFGATLVPVWRAWEWLPDGPPRNVLRTLLLVAVAAGVSLRLHLWFVSRHDPRGLAEQRRREGGWIRATDWIYSMSMGASAVAIMAAHPGPAAAMLGLMVCYLVAFLVIEPATTRATFGDREPR